MASSSSSSSSPQLSASVTRILSLSNFPSELKTRDLIAAFSEWDGSASAAGAGGAGGGGGFKVKWVDDVNAMIVFQDAGVAKKAYLQTLLHPHLSLSPQVVIRPYDGPDAQSIIQSVNARTGAPSAGMNGGGGGHSQAPSLSMGGGQRRGHGGGGSVGGMGSFSLPSNPNSNGLPSNPNPTNTSPPLAHARNPSSGFASQHTRMGSIGSGQSSWTNPAANANGVSPPIANATVVPGSGVGGRRESQSNGGGADAALGEVRRALAAASLVSRTG